MNILTLIEASISNLEDVKSEASQIYSSGASAEQIRGQLVQLAQDKLGVDLSADLAV